MYGVADSLFSYLDQLSRVMTADVADAVIPRVLLLVVSLVCGVLALWGPQKVK